MRRWWGGLAAGRFFLRRSEPPDGRGPAILAGARDQKTVADELVFRFGDGGQPALVAALALEPSLRGSPIHLVFSRGEFDAPHVSLRLDELQADLGHPVRAPGVNPRHAERSADLVGEIGDMHFRFEVHTVLDRGNQTVFADHEGARGLVEELVLGGQAANANGNGKAKSLRAVLVFVHRAEARVLIWKCDAEKVRDVDIGDADLALPRRSGAARPNNLKKAGLATASRLDFHLHSHLERLLGQKPCAVLADRNDVGVLGEGLVVGEYPGEFHGNADVHSRAATQRRFTLLFRHVDLTPTASAMDFIGARAPMDIIGAAAGQSLDPASTALPGPPSHRAIRALG
ncbi:MAG: hypothetical protein LAN62_14975 [Acidobacteriia bacterium]|nr:hypothetical protein [Terriglobia bacterium]